ncbi:hypothetical protein JQX13_06585 [Archangium violaceum]|uniref:hypothetical protein n=1 Tax=Archangium violaceum TaxID=83451 RepID=UPI00193AF932|nr:hypothetical protein [Archangium violaceum]QRK09783.1 hypothetical protein JQX13_06585 [Archangium violaceum]
MEFAQHLLSAGIQHHVLEFIEAPLIHYQRERDGDLYALLTTLYHQHRIVDLFGFTGAAMMPGQPRSSTASAILAWYDAKDRLVERPCTDLGALIAGLEPSPDSIPPGFMKHYPPLRVTGKRLEYGSASLEPQNPPNAQSLEVRLAIHSDIWFPWIYGSAHPACDYERMFDNRELAGRHTPRLNAFLRTVAAKTKAIGGSWSVDPDDTGADAIRWLNEDGIFLDVEPLMRMPPEALDIEWI